MFDISTQLYRGVFALAIAITGIMLYAGGSMAQTTCPLPTSNAYKSPDSSSVWYISNDCTKRPIKNPAVFFSHFHSWDDVEVVPFATLNRIPNNPLGFLPWGQLRTFKNGSLIKTVDDPKVYLLLDNTIYPIVSEDVYRLRLGFHFDLVEDVMPEVLNSYERGNEINNVSDFPGSLVFQYPSSPRVYVLDKDSEGRLRKRYVQSYNDLVRDYRADRIAVVDPDTTFDDSELGPITRGGSLRNQNRANRQQNDEDTRDNQCEDYGANDNCEEDETNNYQNQEEQRNTSNEITTGPVCGNGIRETGEYCDDGPINGTAGECNNSCSAYLPTETTDCENFVTDDSCDGDIDERQNSTPEIEPPATDTGAGAYTPPAPTQAVNIVVGDTPNSCNTSAYGLTGQTYYFCDCASGSNSACLAGNDSNSGLSASAPKRSFSAAVQQFNSMPAGSTVALCRGGAFDTADMRLFNQACTASNRCAITSYTPTGEHALARPIIWSTGNGLSFENGGNSIRDGGYVLTDLDVRHKNAGNTSFGLFAFNEADDIYACNLRIDGFGVGVHIATHNTVSTGDGKSDRIELHYSEVVNNNNQGWLGGCDDCVINANYFDNNGYLAPGGAQLSHSIYISNGSVADPIRQMRITNNEIYRSVHANNKTSCQGTVLVVHGAHDGHVIENNLIRENKGTAANGCWGISVDPGYSTPELFQNITVRNNTVEYVGNAPINLEQCINCTETSNTILHNTTFAD